MLQGQQSCSGSDQNTNVKECISARYLVQPGSRQAVDHGVYNAKSDHEANNVWLSWSILEACSDGDGGKKHLGSAIL